jgi:D-alanine-D-alanine ligase
MKVAVCYNLKNRESGYLSAEYDAPYTVEAIDKALQSRGAKTLLVEANENSCETLRKNRSQIDLVFNIAEGVGGESRESSVPAILEFLRIHYTGPGVECTAIALDKALTKRLLKLYGIPTAPWALVRPPAVLRSAQGVQDLKMPVVVKPVHEGSSIGIEGKISVKKSLRGALERAAQIARRFNQTALIEEYLPGPEITVGILGNGVPKVLPLLEIYTEMYPRKTAGLITKEAKTIYENDSFSGPPRNLTPQERRKTREVALKTYRVLGCRDFGRVDIRFDRNRQPCVMDVNPVPGLSPRLQDVSYFTKICRIAGLTYEEMIWEIVDLAMARRTN